MFCIYSTIWPLWLSCLPKRSQLYVIAIQVSLLHFYVCWRTLQKMFVEKSNISHMPKSIQNHNLQHKERDSMMVLGCLRLLTVTHFSHNDCNRWQNGRVGRLALAFTFWLRIFFFFVFSFLRRFNSFLGFLIAINQHFLK